MTLTVTPKAIEVLRRALEAGRMDPETVGVRLSLDRRGSLRTGFSEAPEAGDETVDAGPVRLFIPSELACLDRVLDVADEHDQLIMRE